MSAATTTTTIILPHFIMLKANNNDKYLRCVHEDGEAKGYVQFTADTGVIPDAKFEVEAATEPGNGGLVHIRSCYNNKYLARPSQDSTWIKAWSPVKDEVDKTHWSCTLFEPVKVAEGDGGSRVVRLLHVQLGRYASLTRTSSPIYLDFGLSALSDLPAQTTNQDVFTVTDWESMVILPKYVAFKGSNGNYLIPSETPYQTLYFNGRDIGDASLPAEVIPWGDGSGIAIKNKSIGNYWAIILMRDEERTNYVRMISEWSGGFTPVKVTDDVIALRSRANNKFCKLDPSDLTFRANAVSMTTDTRLNVVEPVLRRNISVNFRLEDARIYDLEVIAMASHDSENFLHVPHVAKVGLSRRYTNTRSWNHSISVTAGVETSFRTGIPLIAETGITVTIATSYTYSWGESQQIEDEARADLEVTVPPMSKVTSTLIGTKGRCNVPFSYTQTDVYFDGRTITHNLYDGIFNGVNYFGFFSRVEPALSLSLLSSSPPDQQE